MYQMASESPLYVRNLRNGDGVIARIPHCRDSSAPPRTPSESDLNHELRQFADQLDDVSADVPAEVVASACRVIQLRRHGAEPATLIHDSALEPPSTSTRGADVRSLEFACGQFTIRLDVATAPAGVSLVAHVSGMLAADIRVQTPETAHAMHANRDGAFYLTPAPLGCVRIVVISRESTEIASDWVTI